MAAADGEGEGDGGPAWAAYTACAWAVAFAAFSLYYAAGGRVGADLQAIAIREAAEEGDLTAVLWVTAALKVVAALLALALVQRWGRSIPRRILGMTAWGAGALIGLYGALGLAQAGLWAGGVHDVPANVGERAARWKFFFDAYWLLGGVLFLLAARRFDRQTSPETADVAAP